LEYLLTFYKTLIRCPSCTCGNIKSYLSKDAATRDIMKDATGCGDCWYTKFADAADPADPLSALLIKAAVSMTEQTHIVCSPNPRILISKTDLDAMKVGAASNLFLGHVKKCSPTNAKAVDDPSTVTECIGKTQKTLLGDGAAFNVDIDKCSQTDERKIEGKNMVLTYTVSSIPAKVDAATHIERFSCVTKKFTCTIPMEQAMASGKIVPEIQTTVSDAVSGESKYDISLTVKKAEVKVPEDIEATIDVKNVKNRDDLQVMARSCYASPSATFEASPALQYKLVTCHGCIEKYPAGDLTLLDNGAKKNPVQIKFKSFTWNKAGAAKQIFIHCTVSVCDTKAVTCPATTDCGLDESKRGDCPALLMRYRRGIPVTAERRVSIGPITVATDQQVESHVYPTKFFTSM